MSEGGELRPPMSEGGELMSSMPEGGEPEKYFVDHCLSFYPCLCFSDHCIICSAIYGFLMLIYLQRWSMNCLPFQNICVHPGSKWDSCCSIFSLLCSVLHFIVCPVVLFFIILSFLDLRLLITPCIPLDWKTRTTLNNDNLTHVVRSVRQFVLLQ